MRGKQKGSQFERDISKKLSLWLTDGKRNDVLWRSEISGGRFTFSAAKGKAVGSVGDIKATDPTGFEFADKFVVECKAWRDLHFLAFLFGYEELYKAMVKVKKQAESINKSWWLIAKQNHVPILLFMPSSVKFSCEIPNHHLLFSGKVYMFQLDEFISKVKSKEITC